MTSTDILSAQGLTSEQEALAQTIVPKVKEWNEYGLSLMLGYASDDSYLHIARPHGLAPADIRASICKKYNALELPYEFESDEGKLVVQRAIMLKDSKKKGGKTPEPVQPPPAVVEEEPEKVPTQEELDNDLILNVAVEIEKLSDQHLALLVSFSEGESPSEELLAQLGLSGLQETDASRILNAAYDCAGKPTPVILEESVDETTDVVPEPEPVAEFESSPAGPSQIPSTADALKTAAARIPELSLRDQRIVGCLATGLRNTWIGLHLGISTRNVEVAVSRIYNLLDVPNCGESLYERSKFKRDFVTKAYNLYKQSTGTVPIESVEEEQTASPEDSHSGETVHTTSPEVPEAPAAPAADETVTTDPSSQLAEQIVNLSPRRLQFLQNAASGLSDEQIASRWGTEPNNVATTLRQTWHVLEPSEDNTNWRQRLINLYLANGGERDDPAPQEPEAQTIEQPEPVVAGPQETPAHDDEVQVRPVVEPGPTPTEALATEALALEHEDTPAEAPEEPEPSHQQPELVISPELLQAEQFLEIGIVMLEAGLAEIRRRKLKTPDQV